MIAQVIANVVVDIEEVIRNVSADYDKPISEITMDDIYEYVEDGVSYLSGNKPGISMVEDGWPIEGFDDRTYNEIEKILERMQKGE